MAVRASSQTARRARRASSRLEVRLEPRDLATIRQLAEHHRLTVTEYVRQTALGRLRVGVDQAAELERRVEAVERRLERVEQLAGLS